MNDAVHPLEPLQPRRKNQLGQMVGAKGTRTRQRLLSATAKVLKKVALRDVSVSEIVRLARTSQPTFYVYFSDVDEAVLAVIGNVTQCPPHLLELFEEPWHGEDSRQRADALVRGYIACWEAHAALLRVRNLAADEGDARFAELRVNAVAPLLLVISRRIEERRAANCLPRDLHAPSAAGVLLALIERIAELRLVSASLGITRARMIDVAICLATALLGDDGDQGVKTRVEDPGSKTYGVSRRLAASDRAPNGVTSPSAMKNMRDQEIGPKGAKTRKRLLDATHALLQTSSFRGLSVVEIARAANVSSWTFYLYFRDASEAVLAVVVEQSEMPESLIAILDSDWSRDSGLQRSLQFCCEYHGWWQKHKALFRIRNVVADSGDDRFAWARLESTQPLLLVLARRIAECQAHGGLPSYLHPASAAGAFLAAVERACAVSIYGKRWGITASSVARATSFFLTNLILGYGIQSRGEHHAHG